MLNATWICCLLYQLLLVFSSTLGEEETVAESGDGKVRGYTMFSRCGKKYTAFEGIPYAKPPVGPLRFQAPVPIDPWTGVRDATQFAPHCIQMNIFNLEHPVTGQEDCLYLSVYTKEFTGKAPVLVHIHGGGFVAGSGNFTAAQYLMDEDMVVVQINYRLGIFGFLSFESKEMPGNQGMKDQVLALKWVQRNIANFGGDPNLVTIIGESAGAGSVSHHIVSPLSRGLFHRAIAETGSSYSPWALAPSGFARTRAEKLMTLLGCPTDVQGALPCAMAKDANEIISNFEPFIEWQIDPVLSFGPVLEPQSPEAFLVGPVSKFSPAPVPLITGVTSAEGLLRTIYFWLTQTDFKWLSDNFNRLAPKSLLYFATASNPEEITKQIRKFYLPDEEITMNNWVNLTNLYTDSWFSVGSLDFANRHTGDVYFYYFDYILTGSSLIPVDKKLSFGAFHVSEMGLIWNITVPMTPNVADDFEKSLSKKFVKFISDFAKYGTPAPQGSDLQWNKWKNDNNHYIYIDKNGLHPEQGLLEERYKFWKTLNYRDKFD